MQDIFERYHRAKRALFDKYYQSLNDMQKKAVYTVNGPLLILAGAGSGKTTVLVKRIAHIIRYGNAYLSERVPGGVNAAYVEELERAINLPPEQIGDILTELADQPCPPYRILTFTFTNKAANEMKERLAKTFADPDIAKDIWAGTFHSICLRILRIYGERLGYAKEFTIYDADDTKKAVSSAMKACNVDDKQFPIKSVIAAISAAKEKLQTPEMFEMISGSDYRQSRIAKIYTKYQAQLRASNAMDFDDIIMNTVTLLREHEDVRQSYQRRFLYVCVDEYQDTNTAQFVLTKLLSDGYQNIMVVGDDDQSIYRFRGATIENILSFDRVYPDASVIRLEQNYRSTQTILDAANEVISHNSGRKGKTLWTAGDKGEKIHLKQLETQDFEAREIISVINRGVAAGEYHYRDFAVLYRTNAQASSIERAFAKSAMPYRILGGVRFSDRKEIRDIVAYLQLLVNHNDRERLLRIINEPRRKIGDRTLEAVEMIAEEQGKSMFDVMAEANRYAALSRSAVPLMNFTALINELTALVGKMPLGELFDQVADRSGYRQMLIDGGEQEKDRLDNLNEFKSAIVEYESRTEEDVEPTLTGFLEENALVADVDRYDESADAVVMMTIHSAKGLEFPIVFLPGMEDGLFPGMQTITAGADEMEEERRLAYVALTRAKKKIYIYHTKSRLLYGRTTYNPLSRFVSEIPTALIDKFEETPVRNPYSQQPVKKTYYSDSWSSPSAPASARGTSSARPYAAPKPQTQTPPAGKREVFSPGDRVKHMTFGEGEILSVRNMGADVLYEVMFDTVGTKKLMATYARLKKI